MRNETRLKFNTITAELAKINGVASVNEKFSVDPSVQQRLEERIQQSSEFLKRINIHLVAEQAGQAVGLGISRPVASRTNTNQSERQATDPTELDGRQYFCRQTNFDTAVKYSKLDQWAKFKDFYSRLRNVIIKRQALDRIMIGFNGTSIAENTNIVNNPKLQDVNKGWLQKMREENTSRVLKEGTPSSGKVTVGKTGDYKNLDALVLDITNNFIDEVHQENPDLVVLTGRKMAADKYFPLVNKNQENSEKLAADIIISQKRMGNLPLVQVPFFPEGTLLVTTFDNLSIYVQEGARRRHMIDNPKRDQIENYESSNEDYYIEDLGLAAMVENIELLAD